MPVGSVLLQLHQGPELRSLSTMATVVSPISLVDIFLALHNDIGGRRSWKTGRRTLKAASSYFTVATCASGMRYLHSRLQKALIGYWSLLA